MYVFNTFSECLKKLMSKTRPKELNATKPPSESSILTPSLTLASTWVVCGRLKSTSGVPS